MGKRIILISIILLLVLLISCQDKGKEFEYKVMNVIIGDTVVSIKIADQPEMVTQGLMYVEEMDELNGMFFVFPNDMERAFWMKNTLIPLDIIFIDSNFKIIKIYHANPCKKDPCEIYGSGKPIKYVLEVNQNFTKRHNVTKGDTVRILTSLIG